MEEGDPGGVQVLDEDSVDQIAAPDIDTGELSTPGKRGDVQSSGRSAAVTLI